MSKFKEVWHTWNGKSEPLTRVNEVIFRNCIMSEPLVRFDCPGGDGPYIIVAYTTGVKRRRLGCRVCHGRGSRVIFGTLTEYESCHGTGKNGSTRNVSKR